MSVCSSHLPCQRWYVFQSMQFKFKLPRTYPINEVSKDTKWEEGRHLSKCPDGSLKMPPVSDRPFHGFLHDVPTWRMDDRRIKNLTLDIDMCVSKSVYLHFGSFLLAILLDIGRVFIGEGHFDEFLAVCPFFRLRLTTSLIRRRCAVCGTVNKGETLEPRRKYFRYVAP